MMSEQGYTKGEWYHLVDKENRHHVMSQGKTGDMEQNVAVMSVRPEAEANANLIAAAPELYEACLIGLGVLATLDQSKGWVKELADKMQQALSKAEGK